MVSIVIPTYNERENIEPLFHRLEQSLGDAGIDYEIVLVDDDSPDRTWEQAESFAESMSVKVIRRVGERGLASAVVRGIEEVTDEVIVVMDGDLQHPPETVPDLVTTVMGTPNRLVIGSRLTEEGSFGEANVIQHLQTHIANWIARVALDGLEEVSDLQSGFFAFHRSTVEGVDLAPLGYKILLEILVVGNYGEVVEVGYEFDERRNAESNLGPSVVVDYLRHILSLRRRQSRWVAGP